MHSTSKNEPQENYNNLNKQKHLHSNKKMDRYTKKLEIKEIIYGCGEKYAPHCMDRKEIEQDSLKDGAISAMSYK